MKQVSDNELLQQAKKSAEKRNRHRFETAIAVASATQLADFINANFDTFENATRSINIDLDLAIDALRSHNKELEAPALRGVRNVLTEYVQNEDIDILKHIGIKVRMADPDVMIANQKRTQAHHTETLNNFKNMGRESFSALKYSTNLVTHTFGYAGTMIKNLGLGGWKLWGAMANGWAGTMSAMGADKFTRNVIGSAGIAASAVFVMIPVDASAHATILGHTLAQAEMHRVCTERNLFSVDPVSVAFAIAHDNHSPDIDMVYRASLKASLTHGITPEAPFYISYYETNGFRDLVANNSTATNPWQMIDATKFDYIQIYGQKTEKYLSALKRLENGTSQDPDADRMTVTAIDTVVRTSDETIRAALDAQRLPPALFAAMNMANDINFAAELVALDIYKNAPELRLENVAGLGVIERLERTAGYYAPDHFLGATNARYAAKLLEQAPNAKLTNPSYVSQYIGQSGANKLFAVVDSNPGLLPESITAAQLMPRITSYFAQKVAPVVGPVADMAAGGKYAFDLCVINPAERMEGPLLASRAEISYAVARAGLSFAFAGGGQLAESMWRGITPGGNAPAPSPM